MSKIKMTETSCRERTKKASEVQSHRCILGPGGAITTVQGQGGPGR